VTQSAWIYEPAPNPSARARLLCFPPAGGGPVMFRAWPRALPGELEVLGVRIPGRESRWAEALYADWPGLIADAVAALEPVLDLPYVLYGHSFGGMLAYEFARAVQRLGLPAPRTVVIAACRTPHLEPQTHVPWNGPSDELWRWVTDLNGTPAAVLEAGAFREVLEPALRGDLRLAQSWRNDPATLIDSPIVTFGASGDAIVPPHQIDGWEGYTSRGYQHVAFGGGHFFPQEHEPKMLDHLAAICRAAVSLASVPC